MPQIAGTLLHLADSLGVTLHILARLPAASPNRHTRPMNPAVESTTVPVGLPLPPETVPALDIAASSGYVRLRVLKNFLSLTAANVAERFFTAFSSIYVRRVLQAAAIGKVAWTGSVLSYFAILLGPGMQVIAKRDVARIRGPLPTTSPFSSSSRSVLRRLPTAWCSALRQPVCAALRSQCCFSSRVSPFCSPPST